MVQEAGMLPIAEHFTSALLDEFDPQFVEFLMGTIKDGPDTEFVPKAMWEAIANSKSFKRTLSASLEAAEKVDGGFREGGPMVAILCIMAGWKLAEHRMEQLAKASAAV